MLDDTLKAQLQQYLALLRQPIRLIATLDDSETGQAMKSLLETIVSLSDRVSLDTSGNDARKPSFVVAREGQTEGVRFCRFAARSRVHFAGVGAAVDGRPPAQGRA